MKIFSGKRNKKGFTLTEILMAVAILVVAMALIIPGIIGMSENLEITRLDNIAKEIYTAAQSRAVSLSVSGQLGQVGGTEIKDGETSTGYKYVCKSGEDSSGTDMLLPLGSIDENVRLNYYIIEYNPKTAMIKGVYYWEDKDNSFYPDGYNNSNSTDKDFRKNYEGGMVGYYDGESTSPAGDRLDYNGSVGAELVNDEELYLKIEQRKDDYGSALSGTFTVTLTDLDTKKSMEIPSINNNSVNAENLPFYVKLDNGYFNLTLDSLNPNLRFSKIMGTLKAGNADLSGSFQPGCDLRVTVSYKEGNKVQEESFLTNSLFESVKEEGDEKTAYIGCGRHLQNLSLPWVYDKSEITETENLNGVNKAVQTKEIDWIVSLTKVFKDINKLSSFIPIVNGNLDEFDGGGNAISHMGIFGNLTEYLGDKLGIGLFSTFEGNKLENVKLVDSTVKELEGSNLQVGLLAGIVDTNNIEASGTCTVSNCVAYAKVVKENSVEENQCSIDVPTGASVGGLFGTVKNTKIEKCSASLTKITGGTYVGGLVGSFDCGESLIDISNCYADTGTCNSEKTGWQSGLSGYTVGGLLGNISGSNGLELINSYAVGYVSNDGNANGLVGNGSAGGTSSISNCYAALMKENDFVDDLVPEGLKNVAISGGCINYNGIYSCFDSFLNNANKPYIKGSANTTNPYGLYEPDNTTEKKNTASYPFPKLENMPHYGDWPREGLGVLMAYFELYKDNNTGAYSIGFFNEKLFKNGDEKKYVQYNEKYDLKDDDEHTVVMDGYAVMLPVEVDKDGKTAKYGTIDVENDLLKKNNVSKERLIVKYNGNDVSTKELKLMNAKDKFKNIGLLTNIDKNNNWISIKIGDNTTNTTVSYYPLFLSSAMMVEGNSPENDNDGVNGYADHNFYYQKLEVEIKSKDTGTGGTTGGTSTENENTSVIKVWFNPYVAKSEFVKVEKDKTTGEDEKPANDKLPKESIMRTSRQITAYSYQAMQNTASGKINGTHTLRLERNISLKEPFITDSTVKDITTNKNTCECENLSFPDGSNVILELNGKTLVGKGTERVITCKKDNSVGDSKTALEVYGTKKSGASITDPHGTIEGGGISMESGARALLKDIIIKHIRNDENSNESSVDINVSGGVTMESCTITETEPEPAA